MQNEIVRTLMSKSRYTLKSKAANEYQAKIATPFAILGILIQEDQLTDIRYLPLNTRLLSPQNALAAEVCKQLQEYVVNPNFALDLSLCAIGTIHQQRTWQVIQTIPVGVTCSYSDIATLLHSSPRAVGQACGANRLPIFIPCHRVISRDGQLGGFMNANYGFPLTIKRWLLNHESLSA